MFLLRDYLFKIGNFEIKIYAVCIMIGAFLAYVLGKKWAKHLGISGDIIDTGFLYGLVIGVLGSRIFYCVFDDFEYFITKPWTVITEFRNGGLAITGAVIGAGIWVYFYCRKIKIHPLFILELVFVAFFIGQILGRWGNFFNQEAHGGPVPGATLEEQRQWLSFLPDFIVDNMLLTENGVKAYYHPTFLYEGTANLIGLFTILALRKWWKKYWVGDGALIYCMWYGCVRTHIEIMRTDAQMLGDTNIKVAQLIWITMFAVGLIGFALRRVFEYKPVLWSNPIGILNSFNVKPGDVQETPKTTEASTEEIAESQEEANNELIDETEKKE